MDSAKMTIQDAADYIRSAEGSSEKLVSAFLATIEKENTNINAYLEIFDDCLEQARLADERIERGDDTLLTGIPFAVKDNILIEGRASTAASKILEGYSASYDATVIKKLKEAGVVFMGRANMDEFAMGASTENSAYGVTKNPLDTSRVPGGSSGGSAAAVAMGGALVSLGSDTAGSIRQPASFCGLVGLKPTYGSVSRNGLIALGSSLDVIGPFGKSVSDVELVFNAVKGKDSLDSTSVDESDYEVMPLDKKPIIGVLDIESLVEAGESIDSMENFNHSVEKLVSLGYTIKKISLPHIKYAVPTYYVLLPAEASSNLARFDGVRYGLHVDGKNGIDDFFKTRGMGFGPEVRRRILIGTYVLSAGYHDAYYNKAQAVRQAIRNDFEEAFKDVDVIVTPTTTGQAFKLGEKNADPVAMYLEDIFTVPANLAGIPALSIPSNRDEDGSFDELPFGLQIMAPHMCEDRLFAIGKEFLGE